MNNCSLAKLAVTCMCLHVYGYVDVFVFALSHKQPICVVLQSVLFLKT